MFIEVSKLKSSLRDKVGTKLREYRGHIFIPELALIQHI